MYSPDSKRLLPTFFIPHNA